MSDELLPFSPAERGAIRAEFPHMRHSAYLNFASVGPLPLRARRQIDRINDTLQRMDRNFDPETDEAARRARTALARLIGARPVEIGLLPNTSYGLNWALGLFRLGPGDAVLISDHEFPALRYATLHLRRFGVEVVEAPVDPHGGLSPAQLEELLATHGNVRVVATSWVSFHNGFRHDLAGLARAAHARGANLVVDGIQGIGAHPLDVSTCDIDVVTAAAHKWLCCPVGMAFAWCRPELFAKHASPWSGWMAVEWGASYGDLFGPAREMAPGPRGAEAGTINFAGVRALASVAEWLYELGSHRVWQYTNALLSLLEEQIDPDRFDIVSNREPRHRSSILCIRPRQGDGAALHRHLLRCGLVTALREGAVRVSPHFPTERAEIEQLVQSLREYSP